MRQYYEPNRPLTLPSPPMGERASAREEDTSHARPTIADGSTMAFLE